VLRPASVSRQRCRRRVFEGVRHQTEASGDGRPMLAPARGASRSRRNRRTVVAPRSPRSNASGSHPSPNPSALPSETRRTSAGARGSMATHHLVMDRVGRKSASEPVPTQMYGPAARAKTTRAISATPLPDRNEENNRAITVIEPGSRKT